MRFTLALLILMYLCPQLGAAPIQFPNSFIATERRDIAHDPVRGILYISSGTELKRFDLSSHSFLTSIPLGVEVYGIDISPQSTHLVASDLTFRTKEDRITLIDLVSGNISTVRRTGVSASFGDLSATYSVAFLNGSQILIAATGNPQITRFDMATETFQPLPGRSLSGPPLLQASVNGSAYAYTSSAIIAGNFGLVQTDTLSHSSASVPWYLYEIAIDRTGTQVAVPSFGGLFVYGKTPEFEQLAYQGGHALGAAFHPTADLLFVARTGVNGIKAYDSLSYQEVAVIEPNQLWQHGPGNEAYIQGRIRTSRDGKLLFVTVPGGVKIYDISSLVVPELSSQMLLATLAICVACLSRARLPRAL